MKLLEVLEQQLKKEPNYVTDDGDLKKWVVLNKAQNFDEELIGLLLDNANIKDKFFIKVKDTLVFNQNLFCQFLEQKNYMNDSYTQYKNKIGLTINGKYLKQRNEIAFVWPFKDCILEGGQSHEDQSREEIFFNEVLAQDEITQLLEPKVLTNTKRIGGEGNHTLKHFKRNEDGIITDNLIIEGNNLLALHSLKNEFSKKVKLIYIDPPYGQDAKTFYNDTFLRSSWLTFMENRLKIAKEFLSDNGFIFIQISSHNLSELMQLCFEIFGRDNFVNLITVKVRSASGFKTVNKGCFTSSEYILCFSKNSSNSNLNRLYVEDEYDTSYNKVIPNREEDYKKWNVISFRDFITEKHGFESWDALKKDLGVVVAEDLLAKFAIEHPNKVCQLESIGNDAGKDSLQLKKKSKKERGKVFHTLNANGEDRYIYNGREIAFYEKKVREIDGENKPSTLLTDIWTDISWMGIGSEGGVTLNKGKKPEKLLERIIDLGSEEHDLVMDFHLGSGTTAAVAHKMNRQYIGVEQIKYGENGAVPRLINVINGDPTGISEYRNWDGGGEFVYVELKKYNQAFITQVEAAKDTETLLKIWEQMKAKSFLNYNVDIQEQEKHLDDFKTDTLKNQKQLLLKLLDLNQMYVNISSLDDIDFECSEEEKSVTKDFYQIKD